MKKLSFSLLLLLTVSFATAQIATTNWLYQLDRFRPIYVQELGQHRNTRIKLLNEKDKESPENIFGTHFFRHIKDGRITIYKDEACTKPFEKHEMNAFYKELNVTIVDTVSTFDPETFEAGLKVVSYQTDLLSSEDVGYRFEQAWNFNKKTQKLSSTIESLSITNVKTTGQQAFFSVKVNDDGKPITEADLKNDNFILVQRINYTRNFEGSKMYKYLLSDKHLEKNNVFSGDKELSLDQIHELYTSSTGVDTIITINPETFEESVTIVVRDKIAPKDIERYIMIQDFYLDPVNMVIKSKIIAIAPLRILRNQTTGVKYREVPMFWIVYDNVFFERI